VTGAAFGSTIVVPGTDATVTAAGGNDFPFDLADQFRTQIRCQQVYAGSAFGTGPILITGIAFRLDESDLFGQAFTTTLPNVRIDLSTTAANPDALSTTLANNVGADDTIVFGPGAVTLSSTRSGPAAGPQPFDILINFGTPFRYDPSRGNLLFDIRNIDGGRTAEFDADFTMGDATSRMISVDVNSATGSGDTGGLVTEFVFQSAEVPEPGLSMLCGGALFVIALAGMRHRRPPISIE
jgi:hypothetical protein